MGSNLGCVEFGLLGVVYVVGGLFLFFDVLFCLRGNCMCMKERNALFMDQIYDDEDC